VAGNGEKSNRNDGNDGNDENDGNDGNDGNGGNDERRTTNGGPDGRGQELLMVFPVAP
jgi:hypothetical protein